MNVAIISEAQTDEQVVKVLAQAVLNREISVYQPPFRRRALGWSSVIPTVKTVIRYAYFQDRQIDGLIAVMDSDDTVFDPPDSPLSRLHQMQADVAQLLDNLNARHLRSPLRIALGLAVPALEAWLRCGIDPQVNEAAWHTAMQTQKYPFNRKSLKHDVYGSTRRVSTQIAVAHAQRLAKDTQALEVEFPIGFGSLARDLRRW